MSLNALIATLSAILRAMILGILEESESSERPQQATRDFLTPSV